MDENQTFVLVEGEKLDFFLYSKDIENVRGSVGTMGFSYGLKPQSPCRRLFF